ncbi:thioredoxin domain-containing protein [Actinotalea ferrariae]|uniref:DsbA family protein n=1 Tax=Actinotalea ferrariae TaxID=1386098 RepID=UPI001C8CCBA1|nr:thioredoxin domain-containing protein [Actinotalea ferrariae]MBX9243832.1 thioredoxin domain-containing protein [Actinotalea ferrariae]
MSRSLRLSLILVGLAVLALVVAVVVTRPQSSPSSDSGAGEQGELVRPDSPRLTEGSEVQLVEFLDFECESCGAIYPYTEDLKARYGDRFEFVVRYMPLHVSSVNAALAAEAAGAQGSYEEMYDVLFERQAQWGHQQTAQREVFFDYAEELGLDMTRFEADFDDPAALARIERDRADGQAVGVTGTPTFFLDGEQLPIDSVDDLESALIEALDG